MRTRAGTPAEDDVELRLLARMSRVALRSSWQGGRMMVPNLHLEMPTQTGHAADDELKRSLSSETLVRSNEPLARRTTLRVGGPADLYIEPASEADLARTLQFCAEQSLRFFILGRGSNLLVRDGGFRGVVICLAHANFSRIEADGQRLRCGAGAKLKSVAIEAKRHGIADMEFLEGIPGSVGGALRMNAGAMNAATFDVVETVRLMSFQGTPCELTPAEMNVEYRSCGALKAHVALGAVFRGRPDSPESIAQRMIAFSQKRWSSQPAAPSAGCMFKNPARNARRQTDRSTRIERHASGRRGGVAGARKFPGERRHCDRPGCFAVDRNVAAAGESRVGNRIADRG